MEPREEWAVACVVAPPSRPGCDAYQRALDEALRRMDMVLGTGPDTGRVDDPALGAVR